MPRAVRPLSQWSIIADLRRDVDRLRLRSPSQQVIFTHDTFTAAGTPSTTYPLTYLPADGSVLLAKQGLVLREGTDYTVDGTTGIVTVTASQTAGDQIVFRYATTGELIANNATIEYGSESYTLQVSSSADDSSSSNGPAFISGDFESTDATNAVGYFFYTKRSALRFTGLPDLNGATIESAVLRVTLAGGNTAGANTRIYADLSASPTAPTSRTSMTGKTHTTHYVAWTSPSGTSGTADSPDFAPVIQELIDTFGGSALTAIQILHDETGTDNSHEMRYASYDGSPSAAPQLILTYH